MALSAGLLGDDVLAAQTIVLSTCSLFYMNPMGFAIATSTRIGNSLGANLPNSTRHITYTAVALAGVLAVFNASTILIIKDVWGLLFSSDPAGIIQVTTVVRIVAEILPLAALFQVNDGLGAVAGGILRGSGMQKLGAWINIIGYYLIGLPICLLCAFYFKMGLIGLWIGLTAGLMCCSVAQLTIVAMTDWKLQALKAQTLVNGPNQFDTNGSAGYLEIGNHADISDV